MFYDVRDTGQDVASGHLGERSGHALLERSDGGPPELAKVGASAQRRADVGGQGADVRA